MRVVLSSLLALVSLVALVGCGSPSAAPATVELTVTATAPPEPRTVKVSLGAEVTLNITSEVSEVLHVHGYEIEIPLTAGNPVEKTFTANMVGAFEVETHAKPAVWIKLVVE